MKYDQLAKRNDMPDIKNKRDRFSNRVLLDLFAIDSFNRQERERKKDNQ